MIYSGNIKGICIDVRSLDQGQSKDYFAHRMLSSNKLFGCRKYRKASTQRCDRLCVTDEDIKRVAARGGSVDQLVFYLKQILCML